MTDPVVGPRPPHETHVCRDCGAEITLPFATLDAAKNAVPERHPGEPHEFRTTCQRCGEAGYLHVALITDGEVARIEDRVALTTKDSSAMTDPEPRPTDGLAALITEVLRKYGGTMKGRGDHEIFDALVRYRATLATARDAVPAQHREKGVNDPAKVARRSSRRGGGYWARDAVTEAARPAIERMRATLDTARDAVPTHGRHCPCSACKREDWTNPTLAHCGMHGPDCPPVYAPFTARDAVPDQRCCSQENPHRAIPTITDRPRVARHWFDEAQAFPHPAARDAVPGIDVERLTRTMRLLDSRLLPGEAEGYAALVAERYAEVTP